MESEDAEDENAERVVADWIARRLGGRAERLEDLIAEHPGLADSLDRRVAELERLGLLDSYSEAPAGLEGFAPRISGYALIRPLGRGGMGLVWEAMDLALDRKVAIKVMAPFQSEAIRERFQREIATLARLRHPSIVVVYGTGMTLDGAPFISMERIQGEPLSARLPQPDRRPGREDVLALVRIAACVGRALEASHEAGVIHRDVKPGNVLLDQFGQRPVLIDFGLAHSEGADALTRTGEFVGTLAYTAPEQALGRRIDRRADVFGLGATLYHLVTGRPPFPARTLSELVSLLQQGPAASALRIHRALGPDLAVVLDHAVAVDPRDRYASCADLADDLDAVLQDRPIRARRLSRTTRLLRWSRRHKAANALVLVSSLAFVLGFWTLRREVLAAERTRFLDAIRGSNAILAGHVDPPSLAIDAKDPLARARTLLETCIELFPQRPEPYLRLAEVHFRNADLEAAQSAVQAAVHRGGDGYSAGVLQRKIASKGGITFEELPRSVWSTWPEIDRYVYAEVAFVAGRIDAALEVLLDPSYADPNLMLPSMLIGVCANADFIRSTNRQELLYYASPDLASTSSIGALESAARETVFNEVALYNLFEAQDNRIRFISELSEDELESLLTGVESVARSARIAEDSTLARYRLARALFRRIEKHRAEPAQVTEFNELLAGLELQEVLNLAPFDYLICVEMLVLSADPEPALRLLFRRDLGPVLREHVGPFHRFIALAEGNALRGMRIDVERLRAIGEAHGPTVAPADLDAGFALLERIPASLGVDPFHQEPETRGPKSR